MAQTATRDDTKHAAENVKDTADKATETARETAGKAAETGKETLGKAAEAGKETTEKMVEAGKETAGKTVELTREAAGRASGMAKEAAERVTNGVREAAQQASETGKRLVGNGTKAAGTMLEAESNVAQLWMDTTREQIEHNAETLRRLLAARDWREISEIQVEYLRESMTRFSHLVTAQLQIGGSVSQKMVESGRQQAKEVSRAHH